MWTLVEQHVAKDGFTFSPGCREEFLEFVTKGQRKLETEIIQSRNREQAEANLRTFLDEMMIQAERRKTKSINESDFEAARKRLCPLWPFCS